MYVLRIDRPKQALNDYHPTGTKVTVELSYHEMILLERALCSYEEQGKITTEEDKFTFWEFCALRDFCKQGGMTIGLPSIIICCLIQNLKNREEQK